MWDDAALVDNDHGRQYGTPTVISVTGHMGFFLESAKMTVFSNRLNRLTDAHSRSMGALAANAPPSGDVRNCKRVDWRTRYTRVRGRSRQSSRLQRAARKSGHDHDQQGAL